MSSNISVFCLVGLVVLFPICSVVAAQDPPVNLTVRVGVAPDNNGNKCVLLIGEGFSSMRVALMERRDINAEELMVSESMGPDSRELITIHCLGKTSGPIYLKVTDGVSEKGMFLIFHLGDTFIASRLEDPPNDGKEKIDPCVQKGCIKMQMTCEGGIEKEKCCERVPIPYYDWPNCEIICEECE